MIRIPKTSTAVSTTVKTVAFTMTRTYVWVIKWFNTVRILIFILPHIFNMKADNPFQALASDTADTFGDPNEPSYEFNFSPTGSAAPSSLYLNPTTPRISGECQQPLLSDQEDPLARESSSHPSLSTVSASSMTDVSSSTNMPGSYPSRQSEDCSSSDQPMILEDDNVPSPFWYHKQPLDVVFPDQTEPCHDLAFPEFEWADCYHDTIDLEATKNQIMSECALSSESQTSSHKALPSPVSAQSFVDDAVDNNSAASQTGSLCSDGNVSIAACWTPMEAGPDSRRSSSNSTIVVRAEAQAWNYNIILPTWPPAAVYYSSAGISCVGDNIIIPWGSVLKPTTSARDLDKTHNVPLQRSISLPLIDYVSSLSLHEARLGRNAPLPQPDYAKSPPKDHVNGPVEQNIVDCLFGQSLTPDGSDKYIGTNGYHQHEDHGNTLCVDPTTGCNIQKDTDTLAETPPIAKVRSHQRELSERNIVLRDAPASKLPPPACEKTKSETDLLFLRQECDQQSKVAAVEEDEGYLTASDFSDDDEVVTRSETEADELDWDHWDWDEDVGGVELKGS